MGIEKIKVSELPEAQTTEGLFVFGVDGENNSVKAPMSLLKGGEGTLRPFYQAVAPAVYNEQTGFYEINGLTDITEEQMPAVYGATMSLINGSGIAYTFNTFKTARTVIPCLNLADLEKPMSTRSLFYGSAAERVLMLKVYMTVDKQHMIKSTDMVYFARDAFELVWLGDIYDISGDVNMYESFLGCLKLETVSLYGLRTNISFEDSPALGLESLRFLVEHAANTGAITVTVHPDVYAKLTDAGNAGWYAVLTDGQAKQITFATI